MVNHMMTSDNGLKLISQFEGLRLTYYKDIGGIQTIGYGHVITKDDNLPTTITESQALDLLRKDLHNAESLVNKYIIVDLNQNQFDALVSLVFNVGVYPLTHGLGDYLNAGDYANAASRFTKYCKYTLNGELTFSQGLYNRRVKEQSLFNEAINEQ